MRQHLPTDNDIYPYSWLEASTRLSFDDMYGTIPDATDFP